MFSWENSRGSKIITQCSVGKTAEVLRSSHNVQLGKQQRYTLTVIRTDSHLATFNKSITQSSLWSLSREIHAWTIPASKTTAQYLVCLRLQIDIKFALTVTRSLTGTKISVHAVHMKPRLAQMSLPSANSPEQNKVLVPTHQNKNKVPSLCLKQVLSHPSSCHWNVQCTNHWVTTLSKQSFSQ